MSEKNAEIRLRKRGGQSFCGKICKKIHIKNISLRIMTVYEVVRVLRIYGGFI